MAEEAVKNAPEVENFLKNWKPEGITTMDAGQLEGLEAPPEPEKKEEKKPEGTPPAESAKPEGAEDKNKSSLTPEGEKKPTTEEKKEDKPAETPVAKTFEQFLEEKTQGKFKSYEEVEAALNAPKTNEYKSALAEKIDAYVAQGGTEEDYLRTQTIDFNKMSPLEILEYKIQMEDAEMTDEEIEWEIEKRYGISNWDKKDEDFENPADAKEAKFARMRAERESTKTKNELIEIQKKWAVPEKKPTPTVDPKLLEKEQNDWNKEINTELEKLGKLSVKISDTESYEIVMDEKDKKELAELGSKLLTDANAYWKQFMKDGKVDKNSLMTALVKQRSFDKAVQFAVTQAREKGKETIVKDDLKNINMKPEDQASATPKKVTTQDAIAEHARKVQSERGRV